eukprot:g4009.t1
MAADGDMIVSRSRDDLLEAFADLENAWKTPATPEGLSNLLNIYNVTCAEDMNPQAVEDKFETDFMSFSAIKRDVLILQDLGLNPDEGDDEAGIPEPMSPQDWEQITTRFSRFQDNIFYGRETMLSFFRMTNYDGSFPPSSAVDQLFFQSQMDLQDLKPPQVYILFLLGCMYRKKYRRLADKVYEQIFINGHATRAWKERCSIAAQVQSFSTKEQQFTMWKVMTERLEPTVRYLAECNDAEFPDLVPNRRVWSFDDGVYDASDDTFCFYAQHTDDNVVASKLIRKPFAAVYFQGQPVPSAPRLTYEQVPTPLFDSIFAPQNWEPDMIRWLFVLIGRLFWETNENDSWQIIPFLKGVAGTGKSTVIKVIQAMYNPAQVGVLGNNTQKQFGLSSVVGKTIFIVPEVKSDFQLDQAEFQSVVTGEEVSLAVKHESPWVGRWSIPGCLAGNEAPGYLDKSGSISRRIVVLDFPNRLQPDAIDPTLLTRLLASELPAIIRKAAISYLKAVEDHGNMDIWTALPVRMLEERKKLQYSVDPLYAVLSIDIGYKNLAFCIVDFEEDGFELAHVEKASIGNKTDTAHVLSVALIDFFRASEAINSKPIDFIFIEQQMSAAPKNTILAYSAASYFYTESLISQSEVHIQFVPPRVKFSAIEAYFPGAIESQDLVCRSHSKDLKKLSVKIAKSVFTDLNITLGLEAMAKYSPKQDDVADLPKSAIVESFIEFMSTRGKGKGRVISSEDMQNLVGKPRLDLHEHDIYVMGRTADNGVLWSIIRIECNTTAENKIQGKLGVRFLDGYGKQRAGSDALKVTFAEGIRRYTTDDSVGFKHRSAFYLGGKFYRLTHVEHLCNIDVMSAADQRKFQSTTSIKKAQSYSMHRAKKRASLFASLAFLAWPIALDAVRVA